MGGLVQSSKGNRDPWTGGTPLSNWMGLQNFTMTPMFKLPNQLHPSNASAAQKSYNYCQSGLTTKFGKTDDLSVFKTAMMKHLKDTGMDTIT